MSLWEIVILSIAALGAYLDVLICLVVMFRLKHSRLYREKAIYPKVSILISVRNEADHIKGCLKYLSKIDYPKESLEVLIGDDDSEDDTWHILEGIDDTIVDLKVFSYKDKPKGINGKSFVLSQLANKATGDYFVVIDGSSKTHPQLIKTLIGNFDEVTGIANGVTFPRVNSFFSKLQKTDWLFSQALIAQVGQSGFLATAYGHNMCISKEAYYASGGFDASGSSITEDFELSQRVYKNSYGIKFVVDSRAKITKAPLEHFRDAVHQRARWFHGAFKVPYFISFLHILRLLSVPFLLLIFKINWILCAIFFIIRIATNMIVVKRMSTLMKTPYFFMATIAYEFYHLALFSVSLLLFTLPIGLKWKGRIYK